MAATVSSGSRRGVAALSADLSELFRPRVRAVVAAVVGLAAVAVVALLWRQGPHLTADTRRDLGADGQLQAVDQYRTTLLQVTAALGGVIALGYTARNYQLSRRGQTTDRFTQALEKLGAADMYLRIGGVYALEQVARDSPELHGNIVDVLVAFIRTHTGQPQPLRISADHATTHHGVRAVILPAPPEPITHPNIPHDDIQTALTVLGRLRHPKPVNLTNLHLTNANLEMANLAYAQLNSTDLTRALLYKANLTDARLDGADLTGAWLDGADLTGAWLDGADLTGARLRGTDLTGAQLGEANLTGALLYKADLTGAQLGGADLTGAWLDRANLTDARLGEADLTGAQLGEANLTGARLNGANLTGAGLGEANLTGAQFGGANLTRAHLHGTDLTGAWLNRTDLTHAWLKGANLTDASLDSANLTHTQLSGAQITADQVNRARSSQGAELPAHLFRDPQQGRIRDATAEEATAAERVHLDRYGS